MTNVWAQLVALDPAEVENLFNEVAKQYSMKWKPVSIDEQQRRVMVELANGRIVQIDVREPK